VHLLNKPIIHNSCRIGEGTVIGGEGFGYEKIDGKYIHKLHNCSVFIDSNVDIGSNCTIDRGRWRDTEIGSGTKIDNGVHIGHNTIIGRNCMLGAHSIIGGSAEIGDGSTVWINSFIHQGVKVGRNTIIGACSYLRHDTGDNEVWYGNPARKIR
jgi:UDP-3-O-[3-hydroxymyristoyl] glucosamine N-acyltransferase